MIAQFTEHTSAIKIRGKALIKTHYGDLKVKENESSVNKDLHIMYPNQGCFCDIMVSAIL